ncbi:MAG: signal peptide peptidase SppA [Kaiparowitsia implicata GSE-PSE-MK54-09C]|jgi:protease-4|nr:signal peptide peptidase SppA [Kaiparowitsia implicata GSE-PSE-MK54-09C]
MRSFFKHVFATFVGLVLFGSVGLGGLLVLVAAATLSTRAARPQIRNQTVLTINLAQGFQDAGRSDRPDSTLVQLATGRTVVEPIPLRDAIRAIEAAAEDDRITGLYLSGNVRPVAGSGFATLRELRQALETFRESDKPIYAYSDSWSERDYYLTSVATTVMMNPTGAMEFNGLSAETLYFAGALERLGVDVQPIRAGDFKSAVEPFTRTDSSPEDRQQRQSLLDDLWQSFLTDTAASRDLSPEALQALADEKGLLLPEEAQTAGLVDEVRYADEVLESLKAIAAPHRDPSNNGAETFRRVSLSGYITAMPPARRQGDRVALVYLDGDIVAGASGQRQIGGDRTMSLLRQLREDDDVKAVVLRINSPGGSATASDAIAREVALTQVEKPVIASMGSVAASGGYQIATHAQTIYASPNTVTGSIGVFGLIPNFQQIANNNGITWDVVKTGRLADMMTVTRPQTTEELAIQQNIVNRLYTSFLDMVAETRDLPPQQVAEIAQGRVWSGVSAQQVGLVDELGGLDDALAAAAAAASLGDTWQVQEYPERSPLQQLWWLDLLSRASEMPTPNTRITQSIQQLEEEFALLQALDDPLGAYSRLPFQWWIE